MGCTPSKSSKSSVLNSHCAPDAVPSNRPKLPEDSASKSPAKLDRQQTTRTSDAESFAVGLNEQTNRAESRSANKREEDLAGATNSHEKAPLSKSAESEQGEELSSEVTALTYEEASKLQPKDPAEMWAIVKDTSDREGIQIEPMKNRKGWRTIRVFVSSTFKDFHPEREVLVKEVFPDLRLWCEQRKLRLVECDLRWGVPKDATTEETIKICLGELDRCYKDNTAPFFLNLAGNRSGWIPSMDDLSRNLAAQYGWVYGLSVTEMEIVHGAFRKMNPNALFMFRKSMQGLPDNLKEDFIDTDPRCVEKVKTLKSVIKSQFPDSRIHSYDVKEVKSEGDHLHFSGLNSSETGFGEKIYCFFKERIEELYPLDPSPEDPIQAQREAHETFLDSRSQCVLGRDEIFNQIHEYITSQDGQSTPLLIIGMAGAGKSAVMAKGAADAVKQARENKIPLRNGYKECRVFFHFVGATPGSTDLAFFLQRLVKEVNPSLNEVVSDLESLIQLTGSLLSNPNTEPIILYIDAVNQLDEDKQQFLSRWLPETLSPNVKVVVSMIEGTSTHLMLRAYKTNPKEVICGPLDQTSRQAIVKTILSQYNKRLDNQQMEALLLKDGSSNPLWLTLACEELRIFGKFETLLEKINSLPDELISLEIDVFSRFEQEAGGTLMTATVCLLEVSRHGLLETELLALLGNSRNLQPPDFTGVEESELITEVEGKTLANEESDKEISDGVTELTEQFKKLVTETYVDKEEKEGDENGHEENRAIHRRKIQLLPAREWAIIYRNLKQLLRPCGELGEGRLDFYHRSLSKAVRQKYFSGTDAYKKHMYNFWHQVLAGYFENVDDMDRKAEELPYHLELLMDNNRLIRCLLEWPVFNRLFSEDFSVELLQSWRKAGGYDVAAALYKESCKILKSSGIPLEDYADQVEKVIMFLLQTGQLKTAYTLLEERLEMEEKQLGMRDEDMADIYQLMSKCKSEEVKRNHFIYRKHLPQHQEAVKLGQKSLEYRKKLTGKDHELKVAVTTVLIAFHYSTMAQMDISAGYEKESLAAATSAIEVFQKLGDIGKLAEAVMTKTFVIPKTANNFEECQKELERALSLCLKAYGEKHMLTCRIYLNTGIFYEDLGHYETAFDYFSRWNERCLGVLGPEHPMSIRAKDTLNEPMYKRLRESRKNKAAGSA